MSQDNWIKEAAHNNQTGTHLTYGAVLATLAFAGSVIYGGWVLSQSQLDNLDKRIVVNRENQSREINELRTEILLLVRQDELRQLQARLLSEINIVREQIRVLEQTRPTTGELQATNSALRDRIDRLEQWLRTLTLPPQSQPPFQRQP